MIDMMAAIVICATLVCYWIVCRKISLRYQERAARSLSLFFKRKSVSKEARESAFYAYIALRHWALLPLLAILLPPFLLIFMFVNHKAGDASFTKSEERYLHAILHLLLWMYVSKYPLTTIVLAPLLASLCAIICMAGLLMNKLLRSNNANLLQILSAINFLVSSLSAFSIKRRHAH